MKRILLEAPISRNWVKVAKAFSASHDWHPLSWIGSWKGGSLDDFPDCEHYSAWDAFNLTDAPAWDEINQKAMFWGASDSILESMTREEYFTFLYMLNRQDCAATFGMIERDRFMKQHLIYWSNLMRTREIDIIICSNTPHLPHSYAIYLCARQLEIPIVFLNPTPHEDLHYFETRIGQHDPIKISEPSSTTETAFERATRDAFAKASNGNEEPFYMVLQKQNVTSLRKRLVRSRLGGRINRIIGNYRRLDKQGVSLLSENKRATLKGRAPLLNSRDSMLQTPAKDRKQARYRRMIRKDLFSRDLVKELPTRTPFLFLPLHYQPELTTVPLGGEFADQIYLAELIRECMPSDWLLLIKEHWSQTSPRMYGDQGRFPGYYGELARMPSTRLVHPSVNSGPFVRASQAVATISGTAGWEALTMGVPCLLFGFGWYRRCPGVYTIRDRTGLIEAMERLIAGDRPDPETVRTWFKGYREELLHFPVRGRHLSDPDALRIATSLRQAVRIGESGPQEIHNVE